jgi:hypothetical protein
MKKNPCDLLAASVPEIKWDSASKRRQSPKFMRRFKKVVEGAIPLFFSTATVASDYPASAVAFLESKENANSKAFRDDRGPGGRHILGFPRVSRNLDKNLPAAPQAPKFLEICHSPLHLPLHIVDALRAIDPLVEHDLIDKMKADSSLSSTYPPVPVFLRQLGGVDHGDVKEFTRHHQGAQMVGARQQVQVPSVGRCGAHRLVLIHAKLGSLTRLRASASSHF